MLDRKLIDYLPPVLQSVMEFAAITGAQQPEIEAAWDALNLVMDNQFIDTATEAGVTVWEKELGIVPLATDTLEDRKQRLKTAWTYGVVYTYNWLVNWLRGDKGKFDLPIIKNYTLYLSVPLSSNPSDVFIKLQKIMPCNMLVNEKATCTANIIVYPAVALRSKISVKFEHKEVIAETVLGDENGYPLIDTDGSMIYEIGD